MDFPIHFIATGTEYSILANPVPAPYLRKSFVLDNVQKKCRKRSNLPKKILAERRR